MRRALDGKPNTDTAVVADKLFDIISIPVVVDGHVLGALTFGAPLNDTVAGEFRQLTGSEIVFLAHDRVAATTLQNAELNAQLVAMFDGTPSIQKATLAGEHYLALAGTLPSLAGDRRLGYLLLSSYEGSLSALRQTQLTLLVVGLLGMGLSSAIVWVLVRKVTQPLRLLRDGAEAIGRGDFTCRVVVNTQDECGELADAFNQMTGNLQITIDCLKRAKAQLTQSEKLSVIGEFVAGVAHELNNPLASVYGFAQMLQGGGSAVTGKRDHYLDRILSESRRCHRIVQNLLSFARQTPPERKPVKLNDLVLSSLEILQYQLRTSNIVVTTELARTLPHIIGDAHQIQQVFVNIINNARQAIESERSSGKIHITTKTHDGRVRAEFRDDGPGITPENLEKIFTPFFTTKEAGKGTGLGLSLCYGIVQEHGGTLNVRSTFGEGATFVVELPIAEGADSNDVGSPPSDAVEPGGSQ